jgi:hypothetical protein
MFTLSALFTTLVVGYVIPFVTALLTKLRASSTVKQLISAALSAVAGFLTTATTDSGTAVFSKSSLVLALFAFATSQAAYVGLYKPHAINAKVAPGVGIGAPSS